MERLVGKIGWIGQAYRPIFHLMPHMYASVAYALRENEYFLMSSSRTFHVLTKRAKARDAPTIFEDKQEINFSISQEAKKKHGCNRMYRMPLSLKEEINFITKILVDNSIDLSTPPAHIV